MQPVKAGLLYFAIVFGAGFVLGPIRILWAASIPDYIASLDPVAGPVYAGALAAFAVMPLLVARSRGSR